MDFFVNIVGFFFQKREGVLVMGNRVGGFSFRAMCGKRDVGDVDRGEKANEDSG